MRDVFAEQLQPRRHAAHPGVEPLFEGTCRPFETFDAGTLNGTPISYPRSVHGPVIGTATVGGEPYALTRQRSTFGRDALNLAALKDMTEAAPTRRGGSSRRPTSSSSRSTGPTRRAETAYFSSGRLPQRARGLDRRLPTLGTGDYEWRGFLPLRKHPHDVYWATSCSTGTTSRRPASCTATTRRSGRCTGSSCSTSGHGTRPSPTPSAS